MCTVLLPPGDNPIAVNKYIIIIPLVALVFLVLAIVVVMVIRIRKKEEE
jgi:hypothetical protein